MTTTDAEAGPSGVWRGGPTLGREFCPAAIRHHDDLVGILHETPVGPGPEVLRRTRTAERAVRRGEMAPGDLAIPLSRLSQHLSQHLSHLSQRL